MHKFKHNFVFGALIYASSWILNVYISGLFGSSFDKNIELRSKPGDRYDDISFGLSDFYILSETSRWMQYSNCKVFCRDCVHYVFFTYIVRPDFSECRIIRNTGICVDSCFMYRTVGFNGCYQALINIETKENITGLSRGFQL